MTRAAAAERERAAQAARRRDDGVREGRAVRLRPCPRCRAAISARRQRCPQCQVDLRRERWEMTAGRIRALRTIVHTRKGLSEEIYRDLLAAMGVASTKHLTRQQYLDLRARLMSLPDSPTWRHRR